VGGCSYERGETVCAMDSKFSSSPASSLCIHIHLSSLTRWPIGVLARDMERRWGAKDLRVVEWVGRSRLTASRRRAPLCMGTHSWGRRAWNEARFVTRHCFSLPN